VLLPLVTEVALIRIGVREVPRRHVMHDGLGRLADGGDHALDEEEDEKEAQADREGIAIPFRDQSGWMRVTERWSRRRPTARTIPAGRHGGRLDLVDGDRPGGTFEIRIPLEAT
jgi:acetamidase/formamidase